MTEAMMMLRHGTRVELPAGAILEAARRDIDRMRRFVDHIEYEGERRSYAFHPKHIRKSKSVIGLLLLAAQAPEIAEKTTVRNRAMIYAEPDRLIDLAEKILAHSPD